MTVQLKNKRYSSRFQSVKTAKKSLQIPVKSLKIKEKAVRTNCSKKEIYFRGQNGVDRKDVLFV
ncbi:MAG: hypothetical protein IKH18_06205 [Clostridia bacterium]|nr:hypothetical protein [Clostridia bacterium]